jgi:hypothetical protein
MALDHFYLQMPFASRARVIIDRLPTTTSAQLGILRELEVAVVARRIELESRARPDVVAPRPATDAAHPRNEVTVMVSSFPEPYQCSKRPI